jgi:hypothetical protein
MFQLKFWWNALNTLVNFRSLFTPLNLLHCSKRHILLDLPVPEELVSTAWAVRSSRPVGVQFLTKPSLSFFPSPSPHYLIQTTNKRDPKMNSRFLRTQKRYRQTMGYISSIWRTNWGARAARYFGMSVKWRMLGLERGPLSHVSTNEELLERKNGGSGPESREYCRRDPSRWPCSTLNMQKLALTSPTSDGSSVGIDR